MLDRNECERSSHVYVFSALMTNRLTKYIESVLPLSAIIMTPRGLIGYSSWIRCLHAQLGSPQVPER